MPGQTGHRSWFVVTFTVLVALQSTTPIWAWGRLGHRVISRIAEKNLNPKAKAAIAELLEPSETLADASTWADENRRRLPKTAPWHYVDVPLDER
jgi:nuclease S1